MTGDEENGRKRRKRRTAVAAFVIFCALAVTVILFYRAYGRTHISTDDAFVDGRIHIVSSKVPGTVQEIFVEDNQLVRSGDLLLEIDDRDYEVRVRAARSEVDAEKARLVEIGTRIDVVKNQLVEIGFRVEAAKAQLSLQEANFRQAAADLKRAEALFSRSILPEDSYDKAKTAHAVAAARVEEAKKQLDQGEAALLTQKSLILQTESSYRAQESTVHQKEEDLKAEELKKSYTKIYSPSEGYVTKRSVERGTRVKEGQALLAVVSLEDIWVTANYKETQLADVRPGQRVRFRVDTYPGKTFEGTVDSIMAGTGSVFSLFPPENATGNYVKIVQRIPVKIRIDRENGASDVLRVGMSVVPTILVDSEKRTGG